MTLQPNQGEMQGEISYDLIMGDVMSFVEGAYRINSGEWKVFIFSRRPVGQPVWHYSTWDSGVNGIVFEVPDEMLLNMPIVEFLMAQATGCREWHRVRGPDSMVLR
jgi:hypothetical protein